MGFEKFGRMGGVVYKPYSEESKGRGALAQRLRVWGFYELFCKAGTKAWKLLIFVLPLESGSKFIPKVPFYLFTLGH